MAVNIEGIDKADLIMALHSRAKPQGVGLLIDAAGDGQISQGEVDELLSHWEENKEALRGRMYLDYVKGRVVKCDISGPEMGTSLYDRDNGPGAAAEVVAKLRAQQGASSWPE